MSDIGITETFKGLATHLKYPTWEKLMQNGSNEEKFKAIADKLEKWLDEEDTSKVVVYYMNLISLPYNECPRDLYPLVKRTKTYLKDKLFL